MRTPGNDFELVLGWLLSEGVLGSPSDVQQLRYCAGVDGDGANTYNVVDAQLAPGPTRTSTRHSGPMPRRAPAASAARARSTRCAYGLRMTWLATT
jgi:formate dehydrogenase assembly factor FdhD